MSPNLPLDFIQVQAHAFDLLARAAEEVTHPAHLVTLATASGTLACARTVVLRQWLPALRELEIHTDHRSEKWKQLTINPLHTVLLWDPGEKTQLRLRCEATLHTADALTREVWNTLTSTSQLNYLQPEISGSVTTLRKPVRFEKTNLQEDGPDAFRRFGVIRSRVLELDWLILHPDGHLRARLIYDNDVMKASWLIP